MVSRDFRDKYDALVAKVDAFTIERGCQPAKLLIDRATEGQINDVLRCADVIRRRRSAQPLVPSSPPHETDIRKFGSVFGIPAEFDAFETTVIGDIPAESDEYAAEADASEREDRADA